MPPASNPQQETRDAPSSDIVAPVGAEHNTLYVAIEISRKSWVVGIKSSASERIGLHSLEAADVVGLKDLIEHQQTKAERALGREVRVLCCYEAGYEGFWLARFGKRPAEWGLAAMPGRVSSMAPAPAVREVMRSQRRKSRILGAYGPPNPTDRDGEVKKSDVVSHVASRVSLSRAQANVAVDAGVREHPGLSCKRGAGRHHRVRDVLDEKPAGAARTKPEDRREHRHRRLKIPLLQGRQDPARRGVRGQWWDRPRRV